MSSYSSSGTRGTQGGGFAPPAPPDAATIIENEDADASGTLTIEETRLTEEMFADADTDSDGILTLEELEEMLAQGPPAGGMGGPGGMGGGGGMGGEPMSIESIFETEDTDGDGVISAEESALSDEMFSEIDTDQDGFLTAEEIQAGRENKKEQAEQTQAYSTTVTQDMAIKAYQQAIQSFLLSYSGESAGSDSLASVLNAVA